MKAGLTPETWRLGSSATEPATWQPLACPRTAGTAMTSADLEALGREHRGKCLKAMQCL